VASKINDMKFLCSSLKLALSSLCGFGFPNISFKTGKFEEKTCLKMKTKHE
jgi:hypothetical protein